MANLAGTYASRPVMRSSSGPHDALKHHSQNGSCGGRTKIIRVMSGSSEEA